MSEMDDDSKIIDDLGGAAKVAELLGYDKHGGVQRVQNWKTRGIPPKVRLERPDLFGTPGVLGTGRRATDPDAPDAPERPYRKPPSRRNIAELRRARPRLKDALPVPRLLPRKK
jgi:hypothetical protein